MSLCSHSLSAILLFLKLRCCFELLEHYLYVFFSFFPECPAGQTSGCGMVPPPNCTNPNPSTQTDGVDCFCPDGMLIREDGTCALPANCIGQFIANCELYCCRLLDNTTHLHIWFMCYMAVIVRSNTYYIWCVHMSNIACVCI